MATGTVRPTLSAETTAALKLWVVLSRAHAAVAAQDARDVARHGLTPAEFGILEALYSKGPLLLGEVQRKILASSGGITYLVDRLTDRGYVERRACPSDRRARYAALTAKGEELMDSVFPEHAERIADALRGLSPNDQRRVTTLLKRLGLYAAARSEGDAGQR